MNFQTALIILKQALSIADNIFCELKEQGMSPEQLAILQGTVRDEIARVMNRQETDEKTEWEVVTLLVELEVIEQCNKVLLDLSERQNKELDEQRGAIKEIKLRLLKHQEAI